jgi:hypothetical protein
MCHTNKRHFTVMRLLTYSITFLFIFLTGCSSNAGKDFKLTVMHYAGGAGISIIYSIDNDGLQVDTNCDLANCKEATVYKRKFSKVESDNVITTLNFIRLDTLKKSYKYQGYFDDGYYTEIRLRKGLFSSHKSTFDNVSTPTVDKLNEYIDNLVTKPEFRLATWGQTE